MQTLLTYQKAPKNWMEGFPIGNGRLAAMVWGGEKEDRLSLNHEWLWRGVHRHRENIPAAAHLPEVRELLKKGDFFHATALANLYFGGLGGISELPGRVDSYQPAGDLVFAPAGAAAFDARSLDIRHGVAEARRRAGGAALSSVFFADPVHGLIVCRWQAAGALFSGEMRFERAEDPGARLRVTASPDGLRCDCRFEGGIGYAVAVTVKTDGAVSQRGDHLAVTGAAFLNAYINLATDVAGVEEELRRYPVPDEPWETLLDGSRKCFADCLGRMDLTIDLPEGGETTDRRITALKEGSADPLLPLLYFNFGRYLLAASSISGDLPANLQGKWNNLVAPPWESDYHFDINLEMNYWMAEAASMPECADALLRFVGRFVPHARAAAAELYGCRGVCLPLQTDAWGRSTPEAYGWAVWVGAAPWIAQHFWNHYRYGGDREFLAKEAYPFFREVAAFFEDYLCEDESGTLQIMPSQSPENRFEGTGMWPVSIGISATMDVELVYDALGYAAASARILGVDGGRAEKWERMRRSLPPFRIGADGRLLEWEKERTEVEPGHRHLSHLYGLYPSEIFNPEERPAQYEAAKRSFRARLSHGGGQSGWSRAWVACISARIGDAAGLWTHLTAMMREFATVSLLDLHPPGVFQIDGNFGAVAAVIEGLVSFWHGKAHLLAALPEPWRAGGSFRGIRLPGGHTVSVTWENGRATRVEATLGFSGELTIADAGATLAPSGFAPAGHAMISGNDLILTGPAGTRVVLTGVNA